MSFEYEKYKVKKEIPEAMRDADKAIEAARNCKPGEIFTSMRGFYQNMNRSMLDFEENEKVVKLVEEEVMLALEGHCSCQLSDRKTSNIGGVIKKVTDAQKKAVDFAIQHPEVILKIASLVK
jgi:hypothetical protein